MYSFFPLSTSNFFKFFEEAEAPWLLTWNIAKNPYFLGQNP